MTDEEKTKVLPEVANATMGTQLSGIYELDQRLASGGMGEVYRGHNIQTNDLVAIKIVLPEFARDPTILSLFKKEASVLNHLAHDAIVRYHVFTIDKGIGRPYLAMEFVDGQSLFDLMSKGPMSPENVRRLCARLASGLSAAHEAGIIHRDLSPDNIILPGGKVDRAKIIDFGIARSATVGGETLIGGKFAGKYNYVSPEQLGLFGGEITEQSDIYSLGLVLAAALRAEPVDMSGSPVEVVEKRRVLPDLSMIDEGIRWILEAMLQPDPRARPANMAAVTDMARAAGASEPPKTGALTSSPPAPVATVPDPPLAAPASMHPWAAAPPDDAAAEPLAQESALTVLAAAQMAAGATAPPDEAAFVPHMRPAVLDTRPPAAQAPQAASPKQPSSKAWRLSLLAASVAVIALVGVYFTGVLAPPQQPTAGIGTGDQGPILTKGGETPKSEPDAAKAAGEPAAQSTNASSEPAQTAPAPKPSGALPPAEPQPTPKTESGSPPPQPAEENVGASTAATPAVVVQPATEALDDVAQRISWLRNYSGGDCFYATATSATDKAIEIEGFGTTVEPFMDLLKSFRTTFNMEPEVGVRLIEPAQCVVTSFLRDMPRSSDQLPELTLDRSTVPNGTPVSGKIADLANRKTDLILVDHKGMAFNLNDRLATQGADASFSIPIGLSDADKAANKVVPQIVIALTSATGIKAAEFSVPVSASDLLPRILSEMKIGRNNGAATAKYFRLGG